MLIFVNLFWNGNRKKKLVDAKDGWFTVHEALRRKILGIQTYDPDVEV